MSRNWLAVASAEHVEIGRSAGFMQVCHGKASPLRRVQPGDRIVYYSPNRTLLAEPRLARQGSPAGLHRHRHRQAGASSTRPIWASAFNPFRREVAWHDAEPAPLAVLQDKLAFTQEKNWGYRLRQGLIEISDADMTADRRGDVHSLGSTWSASRRNVSRLSGAHIR